MEILTKILEFLIANLPVILGVLGGLGVLAFLARALRGAVKDAEAAAAKTPGKLDDVAVAALKPAALKLADMIESGDLDGAKAQIKVVKAKLSAVKR